MILPDHITFCYHMSLKKQILENLSCTASLLASQPALTYAGEALKLSGCWMVAIGLQRGERELPRQDADERLAPVAELPWFSGYPTEEVHLKILFNRITLKPYLH